MSWALESTVWASLNIFSITSLETIFIFLFRVLVCRIMSIRASLWGWLMLLHQRIQFTLLTILQGAFLEFQLRIAFTQLYAFSKVKKFTGRPRSALQTRALFSFFAVVF